MEAATAHAQLGKAASSFLAGKHQLFIDGKSIDAKSGKKFDVFDPATGQAIAAVAEADKADVDDAIKAARRAFENDTSYGLAASIWTRDLGIAHKLARRIKAGTVWINSRNFGDPALPLGGYKHRAGAARWAMRRLSSTPKSKQ